MRAEQYLAEVQNEFQRIKRLAERAIAQVSEEDFFKVLNPESNSIAIIVKHTAGNLRSRWRDFLTSDGEKPDRNREREFIIDHTNTRDSLTKCWQEGWDRLFQALQALTPDDLDATVYISGEPFRVTQAINRQLTHSACHVGQIVFLAKHLAGERWECLSIPRG